MFEELKEKILNLLFPQNCFNCKKEGNYLCVDCLDDIPEPERNDNQVIAAFDYRNKVIKHLLWKLKYENKFTIAKTLAKALYERLLETVSELKTISPTGKQKIVIIPVPMHLNKLRERGYNQAELLANEFAKLDPKSFVVKTDVLTKTKETQSQMKTEGRNERLKNIIGSFTITNQHKIKNKIVILMDDVVTTGATVKECKKLLLTARPIKIVIVSLAH